MILILRGAHTNEYELQNYAPLAKELDIKVVTSQHPLTPISLPSIKLSSPADYHFPFRRQILNRLIGGEHWLIGLEKLIKQDLIVHTAETYTAYTHQAVELKKRGVIKKLVCTCWETIPHANEKIARLKYWKQESYKYVDLFHVPTERARHALVREGADPKKITVIPYGVDLSRFKPAKHDLPQHPLILTVARLEREKGMADIEETAKLLPDCRFLVAGEGSYRPRGANIQTKLVPYSRIHQIFQRADLFFLPSRTTHTWEEQYGMALIEGMACGLPIVSTRSGAIPEVVGCAGILVPEQCPDRMAKAITDVLTDPARLRKLSLLARTRTKARYDREKSAIKLFTLYQ